jgi:seryl-tRNA synthetase
VTEARSTDAARLAVDALLSSGEIAITPLGGLALGGRALALCRWLDRRLESLAVEAGAQPAPVPATIDAATLDRAGYFEAFGGNASEYPGPPPAVCYHAYGALAGRRLDRLVTLTSASTCRRREPREPGSLTRLWEFQMREVIVVGSRDEVRAERERWMARGAAFASSLGLTGGLRLAADPFFAGSAQGKKWMQQLKELKYEMTMDAGEPEPVAVASFNLHEGFFGSRFAITGAGGGPAHSACAAFGLERWMLAVFAQRGLAHAAALAER